jgi:hypothetical protein
MAALGVKRVPDVSCNPAYPADSAELLAQSAQRARYPRYVSVAHVEAMALLLTVNIRRDTVAGARFYPASHISVPGAEMRLK